MNEAELVLVGIGSAWGALWDKVRFAGFVVGLLTRLMAGSPLPPAGSQESGGWVA